MEDFFIAPTAWYYISSLGENEAFLGLVLAIFEITTIVSSPIFGKLRDKFQCYKFIIIFGYAIKVLGNLVYAMPFSAYCPLIGRGLSGVGFGSLCVRYAQIVLNTPLRYRPQMLIFINGLYCLGTVVGPAISSFLVFKVNIYGWQIDAGNSPGIILSIIWLFMTVIAFWLPNDPSDEEFADKSPHVIKRKEPIKEQDLSKEKAGLREGKSSFTSTICLVLFIATMADCFIYSLGVLQRKTTAGVSNGYANICSVCFYLVRTVVARSWRDTMFIAEERFATRMNRSIFVVFLLVLVAADLSSAWRRRRSGEKLNKDAKIPKEMKLRSKRTRTNTECKLRERGTCNVQRDDEQRTIPSR
ncbi:major facilitator superfamily domain-containing 8 [Paramuricea clavata]|uniref:Major facilitator superfamily domain-containing 8 n=1 Tax=Paramuricea clavata TaxID=317549 RepID=A0A7D9E9L1_PARCT|nr:major facilitator superfamily domain-containing 8 [Paramuricea clavata]